MSSIKEKTIRFHEECQMLGLTPDTDNLEAQLVRLTARLVPQLIKLAKMASELDTVLQFYLGTENGIELDRELAMLRVLARFGDVSVGVYRQLAATKTINAATLE